MRPIAFLSLFLFLNVVSLPTLTGASALNDATCAKLASLHNFTGIQPLPNAAVPSSVCASVWQTNVGAVRGILVLPNRQGILTIAKQTGFLRWSKDLDGSGQIDQSSETQILLTDDDLNHGLALWGTDKILASTAEEVYSWPFDLNDPSKPITARGTVIVRDIPDDGHSTRTLIVDRDQTWLYVSVGSDGNIDTSRDRSLIKRFRLDNTIPNNGYNYATDGEVFASGLRNEVGLTWDKYGVMWGVENGADKLIRNDLGGDIHNDNPAEEVHKFTEAGKFYGYPYCWSEYNLPSPPGLGRGTQWVWPDFANDGIHSDDWCRNPSNVARSVLNLHAHTAPLGIKFYDSTNFDTATIEDRPFTFPPASMSSPITLYIPQHGSWNRDPAVGYRIIRVGVTDSENSITVSEDPNAIQNFLTYDSTTAETGDNWNMRPVDLDVGPDGEMYLTNDSGNIVVLRYFRTFDRTIPDDPSIGQPPSNPSPPTTVDDGNAANGQYQLSILTVLLAVVIALGTVLMQ